jgi:hypothetical protein
MTTKKDLVIVILATFCLTLTLFTILPTHSSSSTATLEYDPWLDVNDDGKMDGKDIALTALVFGTAGDPTKNVNVTNWEVDCYHHYPVEIAVDVGSAAVGNAEPTTCIVHVTYRGLPVRNLISDNFHVCIVSSPLGSTPQGPSLSFKEATTSDGCYEFECKPYLEQQWLSGTYIFYIGVCNPAPPSPAVYSGVLMTSFAL